MKKIALILSVIMIFTLTLVSCGNTPADSEDDTGNDDSSTRSVTGLDGSTITVPSDITKAVSLSPSATLIIMGLGLDSKLVGIDSVSASLANAPSASTVDVSGVAALSPDVVFAPDDIDVSAIEEAGIAVVKIPYAESVATINDTIRVTGKIFAASTSADSMITSLTNSLNVAQSITTSKYDLFLDLGDFSTTGTGTYLNEIISASGGANIFSSKEGLFTATDEEIIAANPEFIFTLGSAEALKSREGWENITAVLNDHVFELPNAEDLYPSQKITSAVQFIYELILEAKS